MSHEMTMIAEIKIPPILKIGGGSFATVAALIHRLRSKRPLIVTDPFLLKTQLADRLASQIRDAGLRCEIFHETVPDPTTTVVDAGVRVFHEGGHDGLVSLGGGSPMDTAKAMGMLVANGGRVRDYKVPHPIPLDRLQSLGCGRPNDLITTRPINDTQLQAILAEAFRRGR